MRSFLVLIFSNVLNYNIFQVNIASIYRLFNIKFGRGLITDAFKKSGIESFITTVYGNVKFVVRSNSEGVSYYLRGKSSEKLVEKEIISTLKPNSIFFDIGANYGIYTILAAKLSPKGNIHSFEPQAQLYNCIIKSVSLNHFNHVKTNRLIVSNKSEPIELYLPDSEDMSGYASVLKHDWLSSQKVLIEAISIDNYVRQNNIQYINLIKIDVEGFEFDVLLGARNSLIKKLIKKLIVEISPNTRKDDNGNRIYSNDKLYDKKKLWSYMHELGYRAYSIDKKTVLDYNELPVDRSLDVIFK